MKVPRLTPAVTRAFAILRLVRQHGALSVREIAAELGLPRSSVHELVHTLVEVGALAPTGDRSRFALHLLLHELGSAYLGQLDMAREGQRVADEIAAACGETVHVGTLDGTEVVYLAKVDSIHQVRMVSAVGRRLPAHCTAVGKALLSALSDEELARRYVDGDAALAAMTPNSITTLSGLKEDLATVRERGYALDECESNRDVRCVAALVREPGGAPVVAMSISVPTTRSGDDWPGPLADLVRRGVRELSRRLGHGEGGAD